MNKDVNDKGEEYTWYRAGGGCICSICGREYWNHPLDVNVVSWDGQLFLHILCDGNRVHL